MKTIEEVESVYTELMRKAETKWEKDLLEAEMKSKIKQIENGIDPEKERAKNNINCIGCGS